MKGNQRGDAPHSPENGVAVDFRHVLFFPFQPSQIRFNGRNTSKIQKNRIKNRNKHIEIQLESLHYAAENPSYPDIGCRGAPRLSPLSSRYGVHENEETWSSAEIKRI